MCSSADLQICGEVHRALHGSKLFLQGRQQILQKAVQAIIHTVREPVRETSMESIMGSIMLFIWPLICSISW